MPIPGDTPDPRLIELYRGPLSKEPSVGERVGAVAGAVGDTLNAPSEWIQQGLAETITNTRGVLAPFRSPEERARAERIAAAPDHATEMRKDWDEGQRGAANAIFNPLNLVGTGAAGAATRALPVVGQSPRVMQAARFLDIADKAIAEAPWKATSKVVGGAARVVGKTPLPPGLVKITVEGGGKQAASSLGEWLGAPSAQSLYKEKVRDLIDMVTHLVTKGHRLERDLFEKGQYLDVPEAPAKVTDALQMVSKQQGELLGQVRNITDPQAQIHALELLDRVEQGVDNGFRRIAAIQQAKGPEREVRAIYSEMLRTISAGRVVVDRAVSETRAPLAPALATPVSQAFQGAITKIHEALRSFGDNTRAAKQLATMSESEAADFLRDFPVAHAAASTPGWELQGSTTAAVRRAINEFRSQVGGHPSNATPSGPVFDEAGNALEGGKPLLDLNAIGDTVGGYLTDTMSQVGAAQRGLPPIAGLLPERLQRTALLTADQLQAKLGQLVGHRGLIGTALKEVWDNARPGQPFPVQLPTNWTRIDSPDGVMTAINGVLTRLGEAPIESVVDLLKRPTFMSNVEPKTVTRLSDALESWAAGDILKDDPYKLVIDAISRDYAESYGVGGKGIISGVKDATALYKEAQLHSMSYLVTNTLGALAAAGLEGVSPVRTVAHFTENLTEALAGRPVQISDYRNVLDATGMAGRHGVSSGAGILADINATKEAFGVGQTVSGRIGALPLGAGGAILGGAAGGLTPADSPEEQARNIGIGAGVGGSYGLAFPTISKYLLTRLVGGMEATVRQMAFVHAYTPGVATRTDALMEMTRAALADTYKVATNATYPTGERVLSNVRLNPQRQAEAQAAISQQLEQFMESRGGLVSPEWIESVLTKAGVRPDLAGKVGSNWRTLLDQAAVEGEQFAGRVHVDYEHLTNFEEFMRWVAPFSTWAMKMTPYFAEHIMTRPAVMLSLIGLERAWEQDRQEKGLPSRFMGSVEVGPASAIASAILGRPVQLYYNPLRGFVPFSDTERLAAGAANEENAFAQAYRTMTSFGPSAHPLLEGAARIGGAFGTDEPARGYVRAAGAIDAATGIDLNRPFIEGEGAARHAISGRSPTDLGTLGITRRIDEMAVQALGHPPRSDDPQSIPYLRAKTQQTGPVWDQAKRESKGAQNVRGVSGFAGQVFQPQAILTPEEQAIRTARKPLEQQGNRVAIDSKVTEALLKLTANHRASEPAPPELVDPVLTAAIQLWGSELPELVRFYLEDGRVGPVNTVREMISQAQSQADPLQAGYGGGGSPEEQKLDNMLSSYASPGSLVPNLSPAAQAKLTEAYSQYTRMPAVFQRKMIADHSPTGYWLQQAVSARDRYRAANPMLDQYLKYLADQGGQGNKQDFLAKLYQR